MLTLAVGATANLLIGASLVAGWGFWYSDRLLAHREQTNALLEGRFALSTTPGALNHDKVWDGGGVQQVWGLGVPLWRLPFEGSARLLGFAAFPDRIAFGIAFFAVAWVLMRLLWESPKERGASRRLVDELPYYLGVPLLLFFPPFITLCRTRFWVYEEVEAYGYLASVALAANLIAFYRRSTIARYIGLSSLSGFLPFIRPTLGAYGLAACYVAWMRARRIDWSPIRVLAGPAVFGVAILALAATNYWRFGSPLEFGHQLNLNWDDAMRYASRFGEPFHQEPVLSAACELFSSLFLSGDSFTGYDWYREDFFTGQSPTIRWREFYFETYDLSTFALVFSTWIWFALTLRKHPVRDDARLSEAKMLTAWSMASAAMLAVFYLWSPFLASRYLIDFAPSFGIAILAMLYVMCDALAGTGCWKVGAKVAISVGCVLWWTFEVTTARIEPAFAGPGSTTCDQITARINRLTSLEMARLPKAYELGMDLEELDVPFNGAGWDQVTGRVKAAITLFVEHPNFLELDVAPALGRSLATDEYGIIQAKVGLEFLELSRSEELPDGRRLTFRGPHNPRYQTGLQTAFVGFVTSEELDEGNSRFRLLRVRWRDAERLIPAGARGEQP